MNFLNTDSLFWITFWNVISMQLNLLHITSVLLFLADDLLLTFISKFFRSFTDSAWNGNSDYEMKLVGKYKAPECCITVYRPFQWQLTGIKSDMSTNSFEKHPEFTRQKGWFQFSITLCVLLFAICPFKIFPSKFHWHYVLISCTDFSC